MITNKWCFCLKCLLITLSVISPIMVSAALLEREIEDFLSVWYQVLWEHGFESPLSSRFLTRLSSSSFSLQKYILEPHLLEPQPEVQRTSGRSEPVLSNELLAPCWRYRCRGHGCNFWDFCSFDWGGGGEVDSDPFPHLLPSKLACKT